jgi:TrmH family RNA methyltransferase
VKIIDEIISSRNNPTVKWAAGLKEKKNRENSECFICEGEKLTYEAINSGLNITHIFIAESKSLSILPKIKCAFEKKESNEVLVLILKDNVFEKISTEISPQGVISVIKHLDFFTHSDIIYKEEFLSIADERIMVLCSVRDPGNLGAVIRSSVAFGVNRLIISSDCADVYNPKTVRGSMASLFRVKVDRVDNLEKTVSELTASGRRAFAAELTENATSISDIDLRADDVFVIGNEGHGIPTGISSLCSGSVYIPISSKTESLNASVAAAVFMWEQSKK